MQLKFVSDDLQNSIVDDIAKSNRLKLFDGLCNIRFGNEHNHSIINNLNKRRVNKAIFNKFTH